MIISIIIFIGFSIITSILLFHTHVSTDTNSFIQPCIQWAKYPLSFHILTSLHSFCNGHRAVSRWIDPFSVDPQPVTWASWVWTTHPQQNKARTDTVWYPSPVAFISPNFMPALSANVQYWNHVQTNKCQGKMGHDGGQLNKSMSSPSSTAAGVNLSRRRTISGKSHQRQHRCSSVLCNVSPTYTHADTLLCRSVTDVHFTNVSTWSLGIPRGHRVALAGERTSVT